MYLLIPVTGNDQSCVLSVIGVRIRTVKGLQFRVLIDQSDPRLKAPRRKATQ